MKTKLWTNLILGLFIFLGKHNSQELLYPDIPSSTVNDIVFVNDSTGYFVTSYGSIYITNNGGNTWELQKHYQRNDLEQIEFINETQGFIYSPYAFIGDDINFLFTSGESWNTGDIDIGDVITFMPISESKIIKSDNYGNISMLDNFYKDWTVTYQMPYFYPGDVSSPYGEIVQFYNSGNNRILALCNNSFAYDNELIHDSLSFILESANEGNTWDTLWIGSKNIMHSLVFIDDSIGWMVGEDLNIYHTTDGGRNWTIQYSDSSSQDYYFTNISAVDNKNIYTLSTKNEMIFSSDGGNNWEKKDMDLPYISECKIEAQNNGDVFIWGGDFLKTTDKGNSWERISKSVDVDFRKIDFVNEKIGWGVGNIGILKTIDGGENWEIQYEEEDLSGVVYIEMIDSSEGWAIIEKSLLKTNDAGATWNTVELGYDKLQYMRGITFLDKDVGVIFELRKLTTDSVYSVVTTDGGNTWKEYTLEAENQRTSFISSFSKMKFTDKDHLWFVNQQGVWLSRDTAKTWSIIDSNVTCFSGFDFYDSLTAMVAYSHKTMAFTKDGCKTWEYVDNPYKFQTNDIEIIGETRQGFLTIACGFDGTIVYYYYEDGIFDYVGNTTSYTNNTIFDMDVFIKDNRPNIWWAGKGSTIVYRLNEYLVTGVDNDANSLPQVFSLSQNYPNPFNPTTTINYSLAKNGFVRLKVYDALGREVASLVEKEQGTGNYEVKINASSLASGIYFYRLESGSFSETKKLVLLR